jgi:hypothetical protein
MTLSNPNSPYYDGATFYPNAPEWGNVVATDSSGIATWYLTTDGAPTGAALFSNIPIGSIVITAWSSADRIYIQYTPVVSADKKTITCQIRQNSSLLGLGLIPFGTAPSGVMVSLRCRGIL